MRKYLRAMARANMRRAGVTKMNKQRYSFNPKTKQFTPVGSYFAIHWREWI